MSYHSETAGIGKHKSSVYSRHGFVSIWQAYAFWKVKQKQNRVESIFTCSENQYYFLKKEMVLRLK